MQKKIIALVIASAMTVPALAYAEASVYGQARVSIDMANDGAVTNAQSNNQLNSNFSRLGFKGSEDLSGGLSVLWQMEGTVGMDTGAIGTSTTSFFDRNTYVGLKSNDMGTVLLGRYDTPYKSSTRKLDVFIDTAGDNRKPMGVQMMSVHDTRPGNSIVYNSPDMSGFSISAGSVFGAETPSANKKGQLLSLAGMYSMENIYVTLAYQNVKAGGAGTGDLAPGGASALGLGAVDDETKAFKLGGSYSMDAWAVNAVYEKPTSKVAVTAAETTSTNLYLSGKYNVSSTDTAKLAYTKRGETTTAGVKGANDASQVAIGYDHSMSKATTVYALYTKITANGNLADPSVLSFGINHSF